MFWFCFYFIFGRQTASLLNMVENHYFLWNHNLQSLHLARSVHSYPSLPFSIILLPSQKPSSLSLFLPPNPSFPFPSSFPCSLQKTVSSVSTALKQQYISSHNNYIATMSSNYRRLMTSQPIPGQPSVTLDLLRRSLLHVYQNVPLETSNFQTEVNYYLNRKESYSGCVVVVSRIKDEQITYQQGRAAMQISVVTDYVPWRLHLENEVGLQQALFLLEGACRGFRELLHRVHSPFIIQGNMIGVDASGSVKVWWNELFYRSNFGFTMSQNVKLRDMVRSLIQVVTAKMKRWEAYELEGKLANDEATFVTLEEKVKALAQGCDLKEVGKAMIAEKEEYQVAMRESGVSVRNNSHIDQLRLSCGSRLTPNTSQRLILTPRKHQPLEFTRKVITKRTYKGKSPSNQEKLHIIKRDIDFLRAVVEKTPVTSDSQAKLRSSRSVDTLFSYRKGLTGDMRIPEVSKMIKESEVLGPSEELMISRFVEPAINSSTSIQHNDPFTPQKQPNDPNDHLFLSRLQNLVGQEKSINSTSRSINDSRLQKIMSTENLKSKFGESEKKIPQSVYFTNLMEM